MAGFVACSTSRLAASSARGIQTQLRNPPLLIAATVMHKFVKMKKIAFVIIMMIAYTGNSQILPDIEGVYYFEYGIDNFNLSINADSTFEITNMISDTVKGRWKLVNDSLFVETFLQESIVV